ncbi:MAG: S26 family signal peptidase, partial [Clostridia bacterium]
KYNNITEIGMVMEITPDNIITNITNYPEMAEKDVMKRTLNRYDIDSRHAYTNRYLGALILFANTIFGRILMLLIPTILIFYHKQIINLINKISSKNKKKSLD